MPSSLLAFVSDGSMACLVAMMATPRHAKQAVLTVGDLLESVSEVADVAVSAGAVPRLVALLPGELAGVAVRALYYIAEGSERRVRFLCCVCCACACCSGRGTSNARGVVGGRRTVVVAGADRHLARLLANRNSNMPVICSLKLLRVLAGGEDGAEARIVPEGVVEAVVGVLASKSAEVLMAAVEFLYELVDDGARGIGALRAVVTPDGGARRRDVPRQRGRCWRAGGTRDAVDRRRCDPGDHRPCCGGTQHASAAAW